MWVTRNSMRCTCKHAITKLIYRQQELLIAKVAKAKNRNHLLHRGNQNIIPRLSCVRMKYRQMNNGQLVLNSNCLHGVFWTNFSPKIVQMVGILCVWSLETCSHLMKISTTIIIIIINATTELSLVDTIRTEPSYCSSFSNIFRIEFD